jgi:DHA2 family multidrug resistance protein
MTDAPRHLRLLHLLTLASLVFLEYLQSVMASFGSRYIMGGIEAAPEEFSLAAAVYAGVAVVMIFKHRWLVQRLGYRHFIRLSLLVFALGALLTGLAVDVPSYIAGRAVQAVGGAAFFTAGRVQVNHYRGPDRIMAIRRFALGLFLGVGLAPFLAACLIDAWGWRALFLVMVPVCLAVLGLAEWGMPDHEPAADDRPSEVHAGGTLALIAGIFVLQFMFERIQYDVFSSSAVLWGLGGLGALGVAAFVGHDWLRHDALIPYRRFIDGRFAVGLSVYFFCYVVSAFSSYLTPVFLVQGLGFTVTSSGWLLSATSLLGLLTMVVHFHYMVRFPRLRYFLWFALAVLFTFGWWMSALDGDVTQGQLFWPLWLNNGVFLAVAQGTAAFGTFRNVNEAVFSQAYQVKNALREVASATGVSLATVVLQMRSTLHYGHLAESTAGLTPWYAQPGSGTDPLHLLGSLQPAQEGLAQLAALMGQQATLMACLDGYRALCVVAVVAALALAAQKKFT